MHFAFRLAHAVKGARHEGVVLHGVGEDHQLRAGHAAVIGGEGSGVFNDFTHFRHGVHVDAGSRGAHVHAGADKLGFGEGLGNGADQRPVGVGHALLHQSGKAAEEVHADLPRRPVQGVGIGNVALRSAARRHQGDGRHGNPLVHDGDAEFRLQLLPGLHQISGQTADLVIDLLAAAVDVGVRAVQQGDAHGDGADVQMLLVNHADGIEYFVSLDQLPHNLVEFASADAKELQ